jgi:imidazolonepropionase-like amidohydrolase
MMLRYKLCLLFFALLLVVSPYITQGDGNTIAIVNGKVFTMAGEVLERGSVLMENGRITAVGKEIKIPTNARRIDAQGKIVLPGMIDSKTRMGLQEIDLVDITRDFDERVDPLMPQLRAIDGINPNSAHIAVTRMNGITSVLSAPGEANVIGGQSAFIRLDGNTLPDMLVKSPIAMHISLGEIPKRTYGGRNKAPQTRMGISALVREAFTKARNYETKWREYQRRVQENSQKDTPTPSAPERDLRMESLLPILRGELPIIVHAERVDDILTALRLADEFGFKLILSDAIEGYKIASQLAARNIPVLYGPINQQPSSIETAGAIYEAAALLQKAGVKIAIHSGGQGFGEQQSRNLPFMAGMAVAYGLPYQEALKAITINPAQILGLDKEVGSIEVGKWADLVICNGDPLEPRSKIEYVFIAGREILLRSYQTDLYEQYK